MSGKYHENAEGLDPVFNVGLLIKSIEFLGADTMVIDPERK